MGVRRIGAAVALLLGVGCSIGAAQAGVDRIKTEIAGQAVVRLAGSANPHARIASNAVRMPGGTRIQGMTMYFALSTEKKAELDALIVAQQTPGSPYYHQWLTPAAYAARFGMSDDDLAKVKSWLEQQGFSVDRIANSRTSISFSGTVAQVESAFGTEMRRFTVNGETHFANATALALPAALDGVVSSVRNLDDFRPKPNLRMRSASSAKVSPYFTSGQSGNHFLTPGDVATIYDVKAAYNAGYTGTGQSIAVVGQSAIVSSDITKFQSAAGLTQKTPTMVLVPGSGSSTIISGDESESDLDVEYAGGMATGATIYFVYVGSSTNWSIFDAVAYAVDTRIAPIISISYGTCETELSTSNFNTLEAIMAQGASQGQSIIASSGDDGSTSCYQFTDLTTAQRNALAVSYPASSNYVTALGGTEFTDAAVASTNTTYWTAASGSDVIGSALSYMPEVVWNDNSSSGLSSTGGGVSTLAVRPSWQAGVTGISTAPDAASGKRMVPDISLSSSPNNAGYLYCTSDTSAWSTGQQASCNNGFRDASSSDLTVAGGTSFAAPVFAGMLAILNQKQNSTGQGLINSTLYSLASNATTYASAFHDITSGSNGCSGVSNCTTAGSTNYVATAGYDEATGLGSIDLYNLMSAWPTSTASTLTGSTTTLSAATSSPSSGASDVITVTVASSSSSITTTPTGTLSIFVDDGTTAVATKTLSSGTATYTFSSTTAGAHTIVALYSGDSVYASSQGAVVVNIASGSGGSGSGGSATSTVTVKPAGGYTGTVTFSLSTSSSYLQNYACFTINDATVGSSTSVSQTLTVYLGTATCANVASAGRSVQAFRTASVKQISSNTNSSQGLERASIGFAGLLFAGLVGWRWRKARIWLALVLMVTLGFAVTGCGGSTSSSKGFIVSLSPTTITVSAGTSGVPTGTYSISVEGDDSANSNLYSTAALSVVVN